MGLDPSTGAPAREDGVAETTANLQSSNALAKFATHDPAGFG